MDGEREGKFVPLFPRWNPNVIHKGASHYLACICLTHTRPIPCEDTAHTQTAKTGEIGSLSTQMRDMAVAAFHGVWSRIYMATCERDCAPLFLLSGNRRSNLPRNCKVTLRVKFIREKRQPTRPCRHELRAPCATRRKRVRCQAVLCCQTTFFVSLFLGL